MKALIAIALVFGVVSASADTVPTYVKFTVKTDLRCSNHGVAKTSSVTDEISVMMLNGRGIGHETYELVQPVTQFLSVWRHGNGYIVKFSTIVGEGMESERALDSTSYIEDSQAGVPVVVSGSVLYEPGYDCTVRTSVSL